MFTVSHIKQPLNYKYGFDIKRIYQTEMKRYLTKQLSKYKQHIEHHTSFVFTRSILVDICLHYINVLFSE